MYLEGYREKLDRRYITFELALSILSAQPNQTIVETGTIREPNDWAGAGMSTFIFGEYAKDKGTSFHSVDNSQTSIDSSKNICLDLPVTYHLEDSVSFLTGFTGFISLLYLDSLDCPEVGDATEAQTHQLNELRAAYNKLSSKSVVLLDDSDFANGGKTRLSKIYLEAKGFRNIWEGYQSLWVR